MGQDLTEAEKKVFLDATNRRKERGLKLKRICLLAESSQVEAFYCLFDSWVIRWGKERAMDELIRLMGLVEARVQDKERANEKGRAGHGRKEV